MCLFRTATRPVPSISSSIHYFFLIIPFETSSTVIPSASFNSRNTSIHLCCNSRTVVCLTLQQFRLDWCHGRPSLASASSVMAHSLLSNHENSLHSGNDGAGGCQNVRIVYRQPMNCFRNMVSVHWPLLFSSLFG